MCFSASASFIAAGLLTIIGAISIKKAKRNYYMFATIPLFFALQQFFEGFVWLSFTYTKLMPYQSFFTYGFLFFAYIVWPLWIPTSLILIEPIKKNRNLLFGCLAAGITITLILLFFITQGVIPTIINHHIYYHINIPNRILMPGTALYLIATIIPFFMVNLRFGTILGVVASVSYIITYYFYYETLTSVWCFFAAILSMLILLTIP